jgi:hypothetical protein
VVVPVPGLVIGRTRMWSTVMGKHCFWGGTSLYVADGEGYVVG